MALALHLPGKSKGHTNPYVATSQTKSLDLSWKGQVVGMAILLLVTVISIGVLSVIAKDAHFQLQIVRGNGFITRRYNLKVSGWLFWTVLAGIVWFLGWLVSLIF